MIKRPRFSTEKERGELGGWAWRKGGALKGEIVPSHFFYLQPIGWPVSSHLLDVASISCPGQMGATWTQWATLDTQWSLRLTVSFSWWKKNDMKIKSLKHIRTESQKHSRDLLNVENMTVCPPAVSQSKGRRFDHKRCSVKVPSLILFWSVFKVF